MDLQQFNFRNNNVKVVVGEDGEPWFINVDVCEILDLKNPNQAVADVDADEKGVHVMDTLGGKQRMTVVSEAGLYHLVFKSRKPEAKAFKRWIRHEVLPSIRKHGGYIKGQEEMSREEFLARALRMSDSIIQEKEALLQEKDAVIEVYRDKAMMDAPKVEQFETYMETNNSTTVEDVAKTMGVSGVMLCRWLREDGILFKRKQKNLAVQKYLDKGWFIEEIFSGKGKSYRQVRVTPHGATMIWQRYGHHKWWNRPYQETLKKS
jgi:anti-repressor protein